ncbi:hypothetical protein KSP40_PGU018098 [Platanthera guangdongensis]|uniref:Uncharacterized protein n=1 Tax=Platanthera guangdongensis TaxID=2320717 RepID=A0ABR2LHN4_9ASPA
MGAKQKIVVISFYQTPVKPPKPPPHSSPPPSTRLPRPKTRGFDRRALLLAYGRQLRRVHATGDEDRMAVSPNWRKWRDEFAAQNTMGSGSPWGIRVAGRRRRHRRLDYKPVATVDGDEGNKKRRWRCDRKYKMEEMKEERLWKALFGCAVAVGDEDTAVFLNAVL